MDMNYKILCVLCISLLFLTVACCVVSARVEINKPADAGTVSIITYTGNLTNVSEMEDVNVPSPSDGETFTWNDTTGVWESQTATATDTSWRTNWTAYNDTWSAGGTDTWVANYSYYYNKTQIDDNNASVTNTIQTDNSSMNNYVNYQNASQTNYINSNNESVTNYVYDQTITTYYNATSVENVTGNSAGVLANITAHNGGGYNISEVNSDFDLRVNFTGVAGFNQVIYRYKTEIDEPHIMHVNVWDYDLKSWGTLAEEGSREHYGIFTYPILCGCNHSHGGVVQLRFYTTNPPPNTDHTWEFDWVAVSDGPATPSSSESDPFSVRKDGTTPLTANWDQGAFNLTNVASWFLGLISWDRINGLNTTIDALIDINNDSVTNTFGLYILRTEIVDEVGNWSADKSDYYTSTEVDILNTSQTNYINSNNASVNNYILYVNSTNPSISYEDGWINGTIDNKISDNNDSINNYIVNYTGEINSSVTNTIETNNVSINNWVTSLAYATLSYVDTVISGIGNWTADKVNYYTSSEVDTINTSVTNTFGLYILRTEIVDEVGNWSADKGDYYTSTEVDILNTSQTNYINANNNSIVNTMVPYEGADKNINISFNNFSIGGGTIWWNGSCMIFT